MADPVPIIAEQRDALRAHAEAAFRAGAPKSANWRKDAAKQTAGSWLFYQGPGQHMWAYRVPSGQVRSSPTTCCQYAVMAAINTRPAGRSG